MHRITDLDITGLIEEHNRSLNKSYKRGIRDNMLLSIGFQNSFLAHMGREKNMILQSRLTNLLKSIEKNVRRQKTCINWSTITLCREYNSSLRFVHDFLEKTQFIDVDLLPSLKNVLALRRGEVVSFLKFCESGYCKFKVQGSFSIYDFNIQSLDDIGYNNFTFHTQAYVEGCLYPVTLTFPALEARAEDFAE